MFLLVFLTKVKIEPESSLRLEHLYYFNYLVYCDLQNFLNDFVNEKILYL